MCRRAFSVIELVVVISVITLMISLALVGIQSARESMRRAQCADRMRQSALAVQSFVSQHKTLPPRTRSPGENEDNYRIAFLVDLLPLIEQQEIFEKLPLEHILAVEVLTVLVPSARSPLAAFKCPSDSESLATNIVGNTGCDIFPSHSPSRGTMELTGGGGPFQDMRSVDLGQITDGMSYTALLSEKLSSPQDKDFSRERDLWSSDYWKLVPSDEISRDKAVEISRKVPSSPERFFEYAGVAWALNYRPIALYNHVAGPNDQASSDVVLSSSVYHGWAKVVRATSSHWGGVNVATADGAVGFIGDSVDLEVWRKLGGRADGGHSTGRIQ